MNDELAEEILTLVRSSFYERDRIINIFAEEMYAPGDINMIEVTSKIDMEIERLSHEKKNWPQITDCDRIDTAFINIDQNNIIALQNAGNTQSDGYEDSMNVHKYHSNKNNIIGYCYYHGQDLERAVRGNGLYLSFGPINPQLEEIEGPKIGAIIKNELESTGLKVEWDGSFNKRIFIPNIKWQKR